MPKILVADDNTNIQKMVSLAFEERGIDVVSVGNGEAAVRRIPDVNPDLVLADIFMPVRNGYEVCEFVKKDSRFSHVPVILLVGAFDPLDEKEARRVGADGVLKKPFVPPDPLIAMVISALEKNPKIAAEMAKAREVPAQPEPLPAALEMPARAEVKPLPEFPEPSAEEAALVYGFGSGKRGNDDRSAEGPAPVPGAAAEEAEDSSEATGHDWRRSAAHFEIPEETSKNTAFALDDDSGPVVFPSEKDVPPRKVPREPLTMVDLEAAMPRFSARVPVASKHAAPIAKEPEIPEPGVAPLIEPAAPPHNDFVPAAPSAIAPISPLSNLNVPEPTLAPALNKLKPTSTPEIEEPVSAPPAVTPAIEFEKTNSIAARGTHWMDAMSAPLKPPDSRASEWADLAAAVKMDLDASEPQEERTAASDESASTAQESHQESAITSHAPHAHGDTFFAAKGAEDGGAEDWLPAVPTEAKKTPVPARQHEVERSTRVPLSRVAADPELVVEPDDSGPITKDPALVEPPAVHVTPEPLLVEEDVDSVPLQYGKREEETEPAFSVSNAAPVQHVEDGDSGAFPKSESQADDRIPTGPPPNREILAEIPFLTPPPEFLAPKADEKKDSNGEVDAVVQKVLEKLEPQLHDLLSQGLLKPLVENILQNETTKKSR